jgi:predicted amidohydrolase
MAGRDECQLLADLERERVAQGREAFPYLADLRRELHLPRQG